MSKIYTRQEIIAMCEMASKDMKSFYKAPFVNYRGMTKDKELYTEIIAEWLLDNLDKFDTIEEIERSKGYKVVHDGVISKKTNRVEEYIAKRLYISGIVYEGIGRIIDYQTPLKSHRDDKNAGLGKIDLLSLNDKTGIVYILELKKPDSLETMLRCVLEGYTYLRIISQRRLFEDFVIKPSYKLKASPLVYLKRYQHEEYYDKNRKNLHSLMKKLDSHPFFLEESTDFKITQ